MNIESLYMCVGCDEEFLVVLQMIKYCDLRFFFKFLIGLRIIKICSRAIENTWELNLYIKPYSELYSL